jgi:hypothetical protein
LPSDACIKNCGSDPSADGNENSSVIVDAARTAVTARRDTPIDRDKTKNTHPGILFFSMESSLSINSVRYTHPERGKENPFAGTPLKRNGG